MSNSAHSITASASTIEGKPRLWLSCKPSAGDFEIKVLLYNVNGEQNRINVLLGDELVTTSGPCREVVRSAFKWAPATWDGINYFRIPSPGVYTLYLVIKGSNSLDTIVIDR